MRLWDVFKLSEDKEELFRLFGNWDGKICRKCGVGKFYLCRDSSYSKDGYCWKCNRRDCSKKFSIRHNSWFENSKLDAGKILLLTYCWVWKLPQDFIRRELGISSCNTSVDWFHFCREVCVCVVDEDSEKIGGFGRIVEIDESKFGKRKFNKGQWVLGGIDRDSKECFFACVDKRDSSTLIPIILKHVKPGTTIISDCWKAYDCLKEEDFTHLKVNHSLHFKDPETGAHTNTIESSWGALKRSLPRTGTNKTLYSSYFEEFCVRRKYLFDTENKFSQFLDLIKRVYNPHGKDDELVTVRRPLALIQATVTTQANDSFDDFVI